MTSYYSAGRHGLNTLCQPHDGDCLRWTERLCMQTRPLFLRTSGWSGVLKALLLERNGQVSCNPKKNKKKMTRGVGLGGEERERERAIGF